MIEISTIQDIRDIEAKILGDFTTRQLATFAIGGTIDIILFFTTHSIPLIVIVSFLAIVLGFFKHGNLNAIEYISTRLDKHNQPKIRTYKNKNIIFEIERQCKLYKSQKKRG